MVVGEINIYSLNKYVSEVFLGAFSLSLTQEDPCQRCFHPECVNPRIHVRGHQGGLESGGEDQNGGRQSPRTARDKTETVGHKEIDKLITRQAQCRGLLLDLRGECTFTDREWGNQAQEQRTESGPRSPMSCGTGNAQGFLLMGGVGRGKAAVQ